MTLRFVLCVCLVLPGMMAHAATCPLVVAHRGASGERPEHTLEAYTLAIDQGADFIEPDLVPTRDGVLIARHENALAMVQLTNEGKIDFDGGKPRIIETTTDVADRAEFMDRLTVKTIDGRIIGGWFSEDFTFAEIRTLKARERLPDVRPANKAFNDQFGIPSFRDVLELAKRRGVGVYPELKHYTWFMGAATDSRGQPVRHDTVNLLLRELAAWRDVPPGRVYIQSFEIEPLRRLRAIIDAGDAPRYGLVQLIGQPDLVPADVAASGGKGTWGDLLADLLARRTAHADVVAPALPAVLADNSLVARLHAVGFGVHVWTLRAEPGFLPEGHSMEAVFATLRAQGIDGVFTDHPGLLEQACAK